ncbi:amyloid fiber anchoring/assembly protein TapA [Neobacillus drentensis]|uniref:amyloid fiber anchoring/assembly protein TapA n=1 Tax=Neobacillus drentensis TaxID=220684 RepID=UPI0008248B31|nr:amyloid fiber anchoring/assembly protein TapA [Neobacillus drentensis]
MKNKVTNFVLTLHRKLNSFYRTNEGGRTIRNTRKSKFRKKGKRLIIAAQLVAIWYLLILTSTYLTSDTGAAFNDIEVIKNSLHTKWDTQPETPDNDEWDKSSLSFAGSKAWDEGCKIYTTIKNAGDRANTTSTWRFYLYKVTSGNEKPTSNHEATGAVQKLYSGATGQITATVSENGKYRFSVRRPQGHPGNNQPDKNGYNYIWSDNIITVSNCKKLEDSGSTTPPSNDGVDDIEFPSDTNQPLSEVTNLKWENAEEGKTGIFIITWVNPTVSNFKSVNVYEDGDDKPKFKNITDGKIEVKVKGENKEVNYWIKTMDKENNESIGMKITVSKTGIKN